MQCVKKILHFLGRQVTGFLKYPYIILFVVLMLPIHSEDIYLHFSSLTPNPSLERVLYLSMGVELAEAGFSAVEKKGISLFTLDTKYSINGTMGNISIRLFKTGAADTVLAESSFTAPINYALGSQISEEVRNLIDTAELRSNKNEAAVITGIFDPGEPDQIEDGFQLLAGIIAGGDILIGDISEYLQYGANGGVTVEFLRRKYPWRFSGAANLSISRYFNNKDISGGPLYISNSGLYFSLGFDKGIPFETEVTLGGGASLMMLSRDEKLLTEVNPYLSTGLRITAVQNTGFILKFSLEYLSIFDKDLLLQELKPSITVYKEYAAWH